MVEASSTRPPKLRVDLVVSEQPQAEGLFFVFKDPAIGRFYRFREPEYFIARQLDGETPLGTVRERAREKLGSDLAPETLDQFVGTLRRLGLLEADGGQRRGAAGQGRVRGNLLYLRFPAFGPDRLLGRLAPRLRFFFTPHFILSSALLILLAFGVAFLNRGEIQHDLRGLWRFDALLLAWVIVLLVTTVHEFAHGLTCKHFGGAVHEMGFMLIYFQPAFYCNVSDAWLFPDKSKRLWVTFAGAYTEIFIWSLATLTWRVAQPETWISFVAMVVMATSGIKSFFNMNPLIKLDGYYLLSDFLEIPNLRHKALSYLGSRLFPFLPSGAGAKPPGRREKWIYVTYGLLSWAYSFWLLGYVALRFGAFLTERYQATGFFLYVGFLMLLLRHPLSRLRATAGAALTAARAKAGSKRPVKIGAAAVALLALLFLGRMEISVSGRFSALPRHNADIEARVDGIVEEICVDEGDWIDDGGVIARLSNPELRAELAKTEAEIEQKRASLKMLTAGAREEQVQVARKAVDTARSRREESGRLYEAARQTRAEKLSRAGSVVEKARARLEYADKDLQRLRALLADGLISRQHFEEREEQVAVRRRELEETEAALRELRSDELSEFQKELVIASREAEEGKAKLDLLLAGTRPEEIEVAQAELAGLAAQKQHLEGQLRLLTVVSPGSGMVTTPRLKLQEMSGQSVKKGDLIAEVHELKTVMAAITVAETDIGEVQVGQKVVVRARAYPGKSFEGTVVSIATAASRTDVPSEMDAAWQREKTFLVTTALDNDSLLLKPGMSGHAKIYCGRRRIFDAISRKVAVGWTSHSLAWSA